MKKHERNFSEVFQIPSRVNRDGIFLQKKEVYVTME